MNRLTGLFPARGFTPKTVSTNGNGKHHAPAQSKALILNPALFWGNGTDTALTHQIATTTHFGGAYRLYWLAYACMNYRAEKLIEPPLWIKEETEDGEDWIDDGDHPLAELLEEPNPDMDMSEFLEVVSLNLDASDRGCLIVKSRDRGKRVGALYPFGGEEFYVESTEDRLRGRFHVNTSRGRQTYGPEDVIWIRNTDPADPLGSLPPIRPALEHVGIGREMIRAIQSSLLRSIRPGAVIEYPGEFPDDESFQRFKMEVSTTYGGASNSGKPMLMTGGAKLNQLLSSLADLGLGPVQDDVEAAVCACFKIHPMLLGTKLGLTSSGGFADSIGPAKALFYDNVAIPAWKKIEKALTKGLLREVDDNPLRFIRFDLDRVRALEADLSRRGAEVVAAREVWTVNEGRVHTGQDPLEDDKVGESIIAQAASGGRMPIDLSGIFGGGRSTPEPDETDPPADEEEDEVEEAERRLQLVKARREAKAKKSDRRTLWTLIDAVTRQFEGYVEILAAGQIAEDQRQILARLEGTTKADPTGPISREEAQRRQKAVDDYLATESIEQWRQRLWPPIEATARMTVERTAASLGIDFGLLQPGLADFTEREVAFLVKNVSDTTRDAVRQQIADGLAAGETTATIAKRVREAGAFSPARAKLIARTESTRATNGATVDTMSKYAKDNGLTVQKSWMTAGDARVRPEHAAIDGETVPVDQPFSNGRMHPDEPNCRCSITTEVSV